MSIYFVQIAICSNVTINMQCIIIIIIILITNQFPVIVF